MRSWKSAEPTRIRSARKVAQPKPPFLTRVLCWFGFHTWWYISDDGAHLPLKRLCLHCPRHERRLMSETRWYRVSSEWRWFV